LFRLDYSDFFLKSTKLKRGFLLYLKANRSGFGRDSHNTVVPGGPGTSGAERPRRRWCRLSKGGTPPVRKRGGGTTGSGKGRCGLVGFTVTERRTGDDSITPSSRTAINVHANTHSSTTGAATRFAIRGQAHSGRGPSRREGSSGQNASTRDGSRLGPRLRVGSNSNVATDGSVRDRVRDDRGIGNVHRRRGYSAARGRARTDAFGLERGTRGLTGARAGARGTAAAATLTVHRANARTGTAAVGTVGGDCRRDHWVSGLSTNKLRSTELRTAKLQVACSSRASVRSLEMSSKAKERKKKRKDEHQWVSVTEINGKS
jgi:hypothetical protein